MNMPDFNEFDESPKSTGGGGIQINYLRVLSRALKFWYVFILTLLIALSCAYIYNRYSTDIYPVRASIIIKESDENAGAKFLYNNALVNPYRNFYNELYILKSYPLLQQVIEELGFTVSFYREGNIKTVEYYDIDFPIKIEPIAHSREPWGKSLGFTILDNNKIRLERINEDSDKNIILNEGVNYSDTVDIDGYKLIFKKESSVSKSLINKLFLIKFNDPLILAKSYANKLEANWAQQGASVVNLSINGAIPSKEIAFISKFIEKYQQYDVDKKNSVATKSIAFLDAQIKDIKDSLQYFEDAVLRFKQNNLPVSVDDETSRLYGRLEALESQKVNWLLQKSYFDYISEYLKSGEDYDKIVTPTSVGITDDVLVSLISELIEIESQISQFKNQGLYQDNPKFETKLRRVSTLRNAIIEGIDNYKATQRINLKFVNGQIKLLESEMRTLPRLEQQLLTIQRNYSLQENLYNFLLQKRAEAGISKASTTSDIIVVNPPMISGGKLSPKPVQIFGIAAGVGLFVPLLIFFFLEILNNKIQSKDDIENLTTIPFIGGIGHNGLRTNLVVSEKPKSSVAEAFRALRSNLNYFTQGKEKKVFMVNSSISGEGKTFTTINLGTVLSISGKRTLIIGADLRKPRLYDDLGLNNKIGLSNYLSGMNELDDVIQNTTIKNLDLLSGGPIPPNPSELIMSERMDELISSVKEIYDFVILDTPPVALVTDAFILSKYVDHTIFLVRQNYTPKPVVKTAHDLYTQGKITRISILFNDIKKSGPGYGYG